MNDTNIINTKQLLDQEILKRNTTLELTFDKPDPLIIAKKYNDEYVALICALFAYGNAKHIVKFLSSFDFDLLDKSEEIIKQKLKGYYYRFQKEDDVIALFIALKRLKSQGSLENIFRQGYDKNHNVLEGIDKIIQNIIKVSQYSTQGYKFLIGSRLKRDKQNNIKYIGNAPYKRYNMFLRWMVRKDNLDMGLWKNVNKKYLILPLDTHTFKVGQKLGLLSRKTYDLKSAIMITEKLKEFDHLDPIKYDFAIYRLGQEKKI